MNYIILIKDENTIHNCFCWNKLVVFKFYSELYRKGKKSSEKDLETFSSYFALPCLDNIQKQILAKLLQMDEMKEVIMNMNNTILHDQIHCWLLNLFRFLNSKTLEGLRTLSILTT